MELQGIYISFVDEDGKYAGSCLVRVPFTGDMRDMGKAAIREAWDRECNPGGEALMLPMSDTQMKLTNESLFNRLLTREEVMAWDAYILANDPDDKVIH